MMTLSREAFRLWLMAEAAKGQPASRRGKRVVGVRRSQCWCPLGSFLNNLVWNVGEAPARICQASYVVRGKRRPLPVWARKFVAQVDAWPRDEIRAQEALEILESG